MKKLILIIMLVVIPVQVEAGWSGNEWLNYCGDNKEYNMGLCDGYLHGLHDMALLYNSFETLVIANGISTVAPRFCIKTGTTYGTLAKAFSRYLRHYSEERRKRADLLYVQTLRAEYPCAKKEDSF